MCGILGVISRDAISDSEITKMLDAMNHRGPDGRGIQNFGRIGKNFLTLGHVRLAILDLSERGHQPMEYNSRYSITFNGEIYNYKEIRSELKKKGYFFETGTDTEVILASFQEYGTNCLSLFNGMFSFSIFDKESNKIFIARDRFGVKPLYYFLDQENFCFASEIKSILASKKIRSSVQPNIKECRNYLARGPRVWRKETLFQGIYRFPKASFFYGKLDELNENFKTEKYYEILLKDNKRNTEENFFDNYFKLLESSVKLRLRADVNIGTALSGGLDSSSIAYLVNKELFQKGEIKKQKTFSSVYGDNSLKHYDESKFIDIVTDQLDVDSKKTEVTLESFISDYEKVIWAHDVPPEGIPMSGWLTYKLVKENDVTISLDGQGADEQLAGYETYLINYLSNMPFYDLYNNLRNASKFAYSKKIIFLTLFFFIINKLRLTLVLKKILVFFFGSSFNPNFNLKEILNFTFDKTLMNLLFHSDKLSMAWSVETRLPFMDYRLVEFLSSLPEDMKINNGWTKYVGRMAMDDVLDERIVWRKNKLGWPVPEDEWMKSVSNPFLDSEKYKSKFMKKVLRRNLIYFVNRNRTKFKVRRMNLMIWYKLFFQSNFANHPFIKK